MWIELSCNLCKGASSWGSLGIYLSIQPVEGRLFTSLTKPLLHCIVLYLYIYIALLAVHTNQKRFQCERPREKRAVIMLLILSLSFIWHEISAVGPEGHCTSHFKRVMCRFHVDVHKGEGSGSCGRKLTGLIWTWGGGFKNLIFLWASSMDHPLICVLY